MMNSMMEEMSQTLREMPWAAASLLIAIVFGMGAHGAIVYAADGDDLRLVANRNGSIPVDSLMHRSFSRVRSTATCEENIPGFTVIVGLSEYSLELSVPVPAMRSMLQHVPVKLADNFNSCKRSVA